MNQVARIDFSAGTSPYAASACQPLASSDTRVVLPIPGATRTHCFRFRRMEPLTGDEHPAPLHFGRRRFRLFAILAGRAWCALRTQVDSATLWPIIGRCTFGRGWMAARACAAHGHGRCSGGRRTQPAWCSWKAARTIVCRRGRCRCGRPAAAQRYVVPNSITCAGTDGDRGNNRGH